MNRPIGYWMITILILFFWLWAGYQLLAEGDSGHWGCETTFTGYGDECR